MNMPTNETVTDALTLNSHSVCDNDRGTCEIRMMTSFKIIMPLQL